MTFSNYYREGSEHECWLWAGPTQNAGYGRVTVQPGKRRLAHRVSYEYYIGEIPVGLHILHSCDTPLCVNPAHLSPGTDAQNRQEAWDRGRQDPTYISIKRLTHAELSHACDTAFSRRHIATELKITLRQVTQIRADHPELARPLAMLPEMGYTGFTVKVSPATRRRNLAKAASHRQWLIDNGAKAP